MPHNHRVPAILYPLSFCANTGVSAESQASLWGVWWKQIGKIHISYPSLPLLLISHIIFDFSLSCFDSFHLQVIYLVLPAAILMPFFTLLNAICFYFKQFRHWIVLMTFNFIDGLSSSAVFYGLVSIMSVKHYCATNVMIVKPILLRTVWSHFPGIVLLSFHHRDHEQPGMNCIDFICTTVSSQSSSCELSDTLPDLISQDFICRLSQKNSSKRNALQYTWKRSEQRQCTACLCAWFIAVL